jgi:hypothetical protein
MWAVKKLSNDRSACCVYGYLLPILPLIKDWSCSFQNPDLMGLASYQQCFGSGSASNEKVGSGPDPHQSDKLDPDPHEWNMSLFEYFFKVLSLYLAAMIRIRIKVNGRIRIRIRIKVTSRIRIRNKVTIRIRIRTNVMRIRNTASTLKRQDFVQIFYCWKTMLNIVWTWNRN